MEAGSLAAYVDYYKRQYANGATLAHRAAHNGHHGCLRVLDELGGEAAASLCAANANGRTPAHLAAASGRDSCLRVLHELGGEAAASLAAVRRQQMPMAARPSTIDVN